MRTNSIMRLRKRKVNTKKEIIGWIFMVPMIFVLYFIIVRPQIQGIALSFSKLQGYTPIGFAGFDNYIKVLKDKDFLPTLWNTVQYVLWSLIIGFPLPILLAFIINEMVHFKNGFRVMLC